MIEPPSIHAPYSTTVNSAPILLSLAAVTCSLLAADVAGTWKVDSDTQIGLQRYRFTLTQDGTKVTGKANAELNDQSREAELMEGTLVGDTVAFVELLNFQGNELRITYTGKVSPDAIKFTRQVGNFATEKAIATRDAATPASPSTPAPAPPGRGGRGGFGGPITLSPDDKPAFPPEPQGFDQPRDGVAHGRIEVVDYDSTTVGNRRKALVYTPPEYSTGTKYPVLYLLHGIGGDEEEWRRGANPQAIPDNPIADLPEGEQRLAHLACGRARARLPALEEGPLSFRPTDLQTRLPLTITPARPARIGSLT